MTPFQKPNTSEDTLDAFLSLRAVGLDAGVTPFRQGGRASPAAGGPGGTPAGGQPEGPHLLRRGGEDRPPGLPPRPTNAFAAAVPLGGAQSAPPRFAFLALHGGCSPALSARAPELNWEPL